MRKLIHQTSQELIGNPPDLLVSVIEIDEQKLRVLFQIRFARFVSGFVLHDVEKLFEYPVAHRCHAVPHAALVFL